MDLSLALKIFEIDSLDGLDDVKLKKLYYKLAKDRHPDKKNGTQEDFIQLREAYLFLSTELDKTVLTKSKDSNSKKTNLSSLSKEEILDKYYHDTKDLELKLEEFKLNLKEQNYTLNKTKEKAEEEIQKFKIFKDDLKRNLEKEIQRLEKKFAPSLSQKLFFFLPKMTEEEFWVEYHKIVKKYLKKDADIDIELFKKIIEIYASSLTDMSEYITKTLEK
jgi:hypothetical protein